MGCQLNSCASVGVFWKFLHILLEYTLMIIYIVSVDYLCITFPCFVRIEPEKINSTLSRYRLKYREKFHIEVLLPFNEPCGILFVRNEHFYPINDGWRYLVACPHGHISIIFMLRSNYLTIPTMTLKTPCNIAYTAHTRNVESRSYAIFARYSLNISLILIVSISR